MRAGNPSSVLLVGLLMVWSPGKTAVAELRVGATLSCPLEASAGSTLTVDLSLRNSECSAVDVRILSGIAGNSGQTLAGIGVFGPVVAAPLVVVPAPTETFGGCVSGSCEFSGASCTTDADCPFCYASSAGTQTLQLQAPPAIPASLVGTVGAHLLILEWSAGDKTDTEVDECLVNVVE